MKLLILALLIISTRAVAKDNCHSGRPIRRRTRVSIVHIRSPKPIIRNNQMPFSEYRLRLMRLDSEINMAKLNFTSLNGDCLTFKKVALLPRVAEAEKQYLDLLQQRCVLKQKGLGGVHFIDLNTMNYINQMRRLRDAML